VAGEPPNELKCGTSPSGRRHIDTTYAVVKYSEKAETLLIKS